MINNIKYSVFALICAGLLSLTACVEKQQTTPQVSGKPEVEYTNTYEFGEDLYEIQSIVRNETVTTIELWLSPVPGLNSINDVMANGNYAVISANRSYLGGRDLFQKNGTYIAFGDYRMDNKHNAMAFIDMEFDGDYVFLNFKSEDLFLNDEPAEKLFSGSYEGVFVNHEHVLDNEWSYNRVLRSILSGKVLVKTMQDDAGNYLKNEEGYYINTATFTMYDDEAGLHEAVSVTIPESKYGQEIVELSDINALTYDNGKAFELTNSANINKLLLSLDNQTVSMDMDFISGGNFLSANYTGEIELIEEKPNHISCVTYDRVGEDETGAPIWQKNNVVMMQDIGTVFIEKKQSNWSLYFATFEGALFEDRAAFTSISIESKFADSGYWFAPKALGTFAYHNSNASIATAAPMPFGSDADAQATLFIESDPRENTCKVVFRIKYLMITGTKIADVEIFYEGPITY